MKRFLLLALCALFALNADARTLYVNAKRPNNNGNGLKAATAKKTIQAAINVAKNGDTILVAPGTYSPIKTNNKKIAIKSVRGQKKTTILGKEEAYWSGSNAELGKWQFIRNEYIDTYVDYPVWGRIKTAHYEWRGTASTLSGFQLKGNERASFCCVSGGTVKHCLLEGVAVARLQGAHACEQAARNARLEDCTIENMYCMTSWNLFSGCTLLRCKVRGNDYDHGGYALQKPLVDSSKCYNCLFSDNGVCGAPMFADSVLVNCTVVGNVASMSTFNEETPPSDPVFSSTSKYYNCILWNNLGQKKRNGWDDDKWIAQTESEQLHNTDPGNVYKNTDTTNKNPKFVNAAKGNYKLKKGSYCINKGKLTKAQKKLVGTKDLAGKARIRGKAIDRGCYER